MSFATNTLLHPANFLINDFFRRCSLSRTLGFYCYRLQDIHAMPLRISVAKVLECKQNR